MAGKLAMGFTFFLLASCGKGDSQNCAKVAGHVATMLRTEVAKASPEEQKQARANLPALQNAMLETCEKEKWDRATRNCILQAKLPSDMVQCKPTTSSIAPNQAPE